MTTENRRRTTFDHTGGCTHYKSSPKMYKFKEIKGRYANMIWSKLKNKYLKKHEQAIKVSFIS